MVKQGNWVKLPSDESGPIEQNLLYKNLKILYRTMIPLAVPNQRNSQFGMRIIPELPDIPFHPEISL